MEEKHPNIKINDLDDPGFRERIARFDETANGILADIELERRLKQPITPEEIEVAVAPLEAAEKSEKDEYGNYIIEEAGPLSPPIPRKSTPEGRASLEAMTSRRSDKTQP